MVMIPSIGGRSPLFTLTVGAGAAMVFILTIMAWQSPTRVTLHGLHTDL